MFVVVTADGAGRSPTGDFAETSGHRERPTVSTSMERTVVESRLRRP